MNLHFWSFALQWSRLGVNALVFLVAARFLTLAELGIFATAYAPVRLLQGLHRVGIVETIVIKRATARRLHALFSLSLFSGIFLALVFSGVFFGLALPDAYYALVLIPVFSGFSSVSDGLLRKALRLRALAIRTALAQGIAGISTLAALFYGAKSEALILFCVLNIALYASISMALAGWLPRGFSESKHMLLPLKTVWRLFSRDLLHAGIFPLTQIGIGLWIGLPAAGAFQIATRLFSMLDALSLSPLRYLALPRLAILRGGPAFQNEIRKSLRLCFYLACWIWFGMAACVAPLLELIIGPAHSAVSAPLISALIPIALSAAINMPFSQALLARGFTKLLYQRAVLLFCTSLLFALPMAFHSAWLVVWALSTANICTSIWFLTKALPLLGLDRSIFLPALPAFFAGVFMWAVLSLLTLSLVGNILTGSLIYALALCPFVLKSSRLLQI